MPRFSARTATIALAVTLAVPALADPALAKAHSGGSRSGGLPNGTGVDVSYPQCGSTLAAGPAFGIVGVDGGLANDYNPCLTREWTYALGSRGTTKQAKAQTYVNTGDAGNTVADWPSPSNYGNYPDATWPRRTAPARTPPAAAAQAR